MSEDNEFDTSVEPVGIVSKIKEIPLGRYSIVFTLGFLTMIGLRVLQDGWRQPAEIHIQPAQPTSTPMPTSTPEPIQVFINGEVNRPGVYELPHDAIIQDVLLEAGGFTAEAYRDIVNLAQPLSDGMQVYVPTLSDASNEPPLPLISTPPTVTNDNGGSDGGGIINLNTATMSQLESLPGIGPSTAQKILDYREDNGLFGSIEEVMNVSGIGPAKFEAMEPYITVDG